MYEMIEKFICGDLLIKIDSATHEDLRNLAALLEETTLPTWCDSGNMYNDLVNTKSQYEYLFVTKMTIHARHTPIKEFDLFEEGEDCEWVTAKEFVENCNMQEIQISLDDIENIFEVENA